MLNDERESPADRPAGYRRSSYASRHRCQLSQTPALHANPDDVSAQIDLIGVAWLMIGEELSGAPNCGSARG
jgi:hypothetical protein